MKPSFLKTQKSVKALCKCLIKKIEKGVSSQNGALMKKGLRLQYQVLISLISRSERCPDEEGIKTLRSPVFCGTMMSERCPDEEGIKTLFETQGNIFNLSERCPDEEGIKTGELSEIIVKCWVRTVP